MTNEQLQRKGTTAMTCPNCQRLESRIAELEAAASHVQMQQRLTRLHRKLIAAGLDPLDQTAVSPLFIQLCFECKTEQRLNAWIQDRAAVIRCARANRANEFAATKRINHSLDDGDSGGSADD